MIDEDGDEELDSDEDGMLLPQPPPSSADSLGELNTQILLDRARNGSHSAWEVFYRRYKDFLVWNIRVKMPEFARRQFDAEDVLQSAFLAAWNNIFHFEYQGEGSFRRYLRMIVLNHFRNRIKRLEARGRTVSADDQALDFAHGAHQESGHDDPAEIYASEDALRNYIEKLNELSDDDQELIGMHFYEGMTWTEMSVILGCDRETAKDWTFKALKRLERKIGPT